MAALQNVMFCHIGAACDLVLNVRFYKVLALANSRLNGISTDRNRTVLTLSFIKSAAV